MNPFRWLRSWFGLQRGGSTSRLAHMVRIDLDAEHDTLAEARLKDAIRQAVLRERMACAALALESPAYVTGPPGVNVLIAQRIVGRPLP